MEPVCRVYDSNDSFTVWVQFFLCCFAFAALYLKRLNEVPRRKFRTWFMDVSKQGVGACYAHVMNMTIASIIVRLYQSDVELDDECAWYAINYVIDSTLGLVLSIIFLQTLTSVAKKNDWSCLMHPGVYVGDEGICHWWIQSLSWMAILTITKVLQCFFIFLVYEPLVIIGTFVFGPLESNIRFELLFVMILFPGILNVIYFWIADSYLKADTKHKDAHELEFLSTCGPLLQTECDGNKKPLLDDGVQTQTNYLTV